MSARRTVLAWSTGASCGLLVGWLYGSVTLDWLSWRAVRRPGGRTGAPGTPGHLGPSAALTAPIPAQRDDEPTLDERGHCTAMSPGGGLRCIVSGPHRGHWWEAVYAPDRKDDTDEGIE